MRRFHQALLGALRKEDGITAVEYATILSVLMMIGAAVLTVLGPSTFSAPKKADVQESRPVQKRL